jgi:leader peptidase (prepilin peptidase) / N-methyltransferase
MTVELLVPLAAVAGALLGFGADRLATRWPAHEEGVVARRLDWRTAVTTLVGALALGATAARWPDGPALLVLAPYAAALVVLLATDLDQKLLPDVITLPLIAYSAVVLVAGWSPLLAGRELALVSGVAAGLGAPVFLFVTDLLLKGALGMGDLKLAVSIGLMSGVTRLFAGFLIASIVFAAALLLLIALRRIGLRTAIPFGPVLIGAAFVAILVT